MSRLIALTRREVGHLFLMPPLYIVTAFFVLLYGIIFFLSPIETGQAEFSSVILFILYMSITFGPLITMQSFAGETQSGTFELLITAPVRPAEIVVSKFLGSFGFYLASLSPCIVYIGLLQHFGDVDSGVILTSMIGLLLAGSAFIAIGLLASSFTTNQIVAAATSCTTLIILFLLTYADPRGAWYERALNGIAFLPHFEGSFLQGELDTRDVLYFLTLIFGMLFMTWLRISSRGIFASTRETHRTTALFSGVSFALGITLIIVGAGYVHVNTTSLAALLELWAAGDIAGFLREGAVIVMGGVALLVALGLWILARRQQTNPDSTAPKPQPLPALPPRSRQGLAIWLAAFSMLVILMNINYSGSFIYQKWDLSDNLENSLSPDTQNTLSSLDDEVVITVFLTTEQNYKGAEPDKVDTRKKLVTDVKELLTRMSDFSAKIKFQMLDPVYSGNAAIEKAQALGLPLERLSEIIHIRYGDERQTLLQAQQLLKPPPAIARMKGYKTKSFNGEFAFTHSLRVLMDPRQTRIFFSSGKGEFPIHGRAPKNRSMATIARELSARMYGVQSLMLDARSLARLEADDILIMGGPVLPLESELVAELESFVNRGGKLILLLPTVQTVQRGQSREIDLPESHQALWGLMAKWGVAPRFDYMFDDMNNDGGVTSHIIARLGGTKEVLTASRQPGILFPGGRSLQINREIMAKTKWRIQPILMSGQSSYSVERIVEKRKAGARPRFRNRARSARVLAAFCARPATETEPERRVIIVGNTAFANDVWLNGGKSRWANNAFMHRLVRLMTSRDYETTIEPKEFVDRSFQLTQAQHKTIGWVSMVAPPYLWLLLGVGVWWFRRQ